MGEVSSLSQLGNDFGIARLNADGSLDNTFSDDGLTSVEISSQNHATGVGLLSDGRIVVGGYCGEEYGLACFKPDGSLDLGFNGTGTVLTLQGGYGGRVLDLLVQPDDKIVVVGEVNLVQGTGDDIRLIRYNNDGSIDSGFGVNGVVTTDLFQTREVAQTTAILPDGSILVAGLVATQYDNDFVLVKYRTDGTPDNSFGTGGYVTLDLGGATDDIGYAVTVQPDGKIIVAGRTWLRDGGNARFTLARFHDDGSLDANFGVNGKIINDAITIVDNDPDKTNDLCYAVALQSDGRILAAGSSNYQVAVVRYHSDVTADVAHIGKPAGSIFPNPAHDFVQVSHEKPNAGLTYSIISSVGQVFIQGMLDTSTQHIDISGLPAGMYYTRLSAPGHPAQVIPFTKQ